MALAPNDVLNKKFNTTRLRSGYDETQVDDFLDQVVIELRRLIAANKELQTQLDDCRAGRGLDGAEGGDEAGALPSGADEEQLKLREERDTLTTEVEELSARAERMRAEADAEERRLAQLREQAAQTEGQAGASSAAPGGAAVEDPTSIISLAQRLHDQHVQEGVSTKQRLISEAETYRDNVVADADRRSQELVQTGQARHDELVQAGQAKHDELVQSGQAKYAQLVGEAEQRRSDVLTDLDTRRATLSTRIEDLKAFEQEYRGRLRGLLTEQMDLLDRDGDGLPDPVPDRG